MNNQDILSNDRNAPAKIGHLGRRILSYDLLVSKLGCTLITNMSSFGVPCLNKGNKQRSKALEKLCDLLNENPEVKTAQLLLLTSS